MGRVLAPHRQAAPQRPPEPLGDEPLEQVVHVHHEGHRRPPPRPVDEGQILQHQPGQVQSGPVMLVEPVELDSVEVAGLDPSVGHLLQVGDQAEQPASVLDRHQRHPQGQAQGRLQVVVLPDVGGEVVVAAVEREGQPASGDHGRQVGAAPHGRQSLAAL